MDIQSFSAAREMEAFALEAAREGALVLTPTSRLAKRYRHAFRLAVREGGGSAAWDSPEISSFRRWVKQAFDGLWETRAPAGKAALMALWASAVETARNEGPAPPDGIEASPALFAALQSAYDSVRQSEIPEAARDESEVSRWRAEVARRFEKLCSSRGVLCWHEVMEAARVAIQKGRVPLPARAVVILGELPIKPPLERFLATLSDRTRLGLVAPPGAFPASGSKAPCLVYAAPEQECRAACSRALEHWNRTGGRASLALVTLDDSLLPLLERCLDELAGRRPLRGEGEVRYNLAWGTPLPGHPLFVAGTLPLSLAAQPDAVWGLAALVRSPYADPGRFEGFEETLGRLWAPGERVPLDRAVREITKRFPSLSPLRDCLPAKRAPVGEWVQRLRRLWKALGFPWRSGSAAVRDQTATAHAQLEEALRELERHCGGTRTDAPGALAWLTALCEGQKVSDPTAETAGIQVLPAAEAFGLPFDAVWCVGAHGESLPRAKPPEPLLSPAESLALSGGDHQKRSWEEGAALLRGLLGSCEEPSRVTFSRSKSESDGQRPFTSSPLLEDRFKPGSSDEAELFDVWGAEARLWLGAPWLAGAARGLAAPASVAAVPAGALPRGLRSPLSVTSLDVLLKCPFHYFASRELGLEPPPEASEGIPPMARGTLIHGICGEFTRLLPQEVPGWWDQMEEAWDLLRRVARERLSRESGPYWSAEAVRLLGEDERGSKGLLRAWLEAEREWAAKGWRHEPPSGEAERPFKGLELRGTGVLLEGRVDRVDFNENAGARAVWDYKSGSPPSAAQVLRDMTEAQLPAYLLALQAGRLDPEEDGRARPWEGGLGAGYIPLQKASKVTLRPLDFEGEHGSAGAFLGRWAERAKERLEDPLKGLFKADPRPPAAFPGEPGTACEFCPFGALCGFFDTPREGVSEEAEE